VLVEAYSSWIRVLKSDMYVSWIDDMTIHVWTLHIHSYYTHPLMYLSKVIKKVHSFYSEVDISREFA
jgi:hypothetical protein